MLNFRKAAFAVALAAGVAGLTGGIGAQAQTIKAVMHSDVKILDPIWTTAYIQRNFGYMVWDTLFAFDEKFEVKPQMVDKWTVSDDKLTWTFTLRDGLEWSNGTPVTSEDCIASIKRWAARDSMGQKLIASVKSLEAVDAKTFKMNMKEPYGLVLQSLGKPSSNVPFMMPKKTADTDPMQQIKVEDVVGSGPFVFVASEWKPGEKIVFTKNAKYKPRSEPASGLAGGKVVKVDRVEWIAMPDVQTQVAALQNGEIDMIEQPAHDLLPVLEKDRNIEIVVPDKLGNTYILRMNWKQPPFDDLRYRRAAELALNQQDFLKAVIGDQRLRHHLPAEDAPPARLGVLAAEQVDHLLNALRGVGIPCAQRQFDALGRIRPPRETQGAFALRRWFGGGAQREGDHQAEEETHAFRCRSRGASGRRPSRATTMSGGAWARARCEAPIGNVNAAATATSQERKFKARTS